jgi:hypothetical protein
VVARQTGVRLGRPSIIYSRADKLADETRARYTTAIQFIWDEIDQKRGSIKGRGNGKTYTLPELIEHEKQERAQLAKSFKWPAK